MLILFLRTFKYIFSYFSPFKNECASKCVQRSFSARHFPSVVGTPHPSATAHHALHSTLPFDNSPSVRQLTLRFDSSPFRLTLDSVSVECQREFQSKGKGLRMFAKRELQSGECFLQEHPVVSHRTLCQRRHQQMADVVRQRSIRACHVDADFQTIMPMMPAPQRVTATTIHHHR